MILAGLCLARKRQVGLPMPEFPNDCYLSLLGTVRGFQLTACDYNYLSIKAWNVRIDVKSLLPEVTHDLMFKKSKTMEEVIEAADVLRVLKRRFEVIS